MPVYSLVYASRSTRDFSQDDLDELARRANLKNRTLRITGYLCHRDGIFFQYLEGPLTELNSLMETLKEDDRHNIFNEIDLGQIDSRHFPDWHMRCLKAKGLKMIQMEEVLSQVLESMCEANYGRDRLRKLIHPMIARIAERQAVLSN